MWMEHSSCSLQQCFRLRKLVFLCSCVHWAESDHRSLNFFLITYSLAIMEFPQHTVCMKCGMVDAIDSNNTEEVRKSLLAHFDSINDSDSVIGGDFMARVISEASFVEEKNVVNTILKFINLKARDELARRLIVAVFKGDLQLVETLLSENGDCLKSPEWCNGYGFLPPLYSSIFARINIETHKRKEVLQLFLKYGLDTRIWIVAGGPFDGNILHAFVSNYVEEDDHDAVEIAEILIDSGIPVDESDNFCESPLTLAVEAQNKSLISFLIERGADVNRKNLRVHPLHQSIESYCDEDIINLLLSGGAEINFKDESGMTPLYWACLKRYDKGIGLLLRKSADISSEADNNETPFGVLLIPAYNEDGDSSEICIITMIKEFSRLPFEKIKISEKDLELIRTNSQLQSHFENCQIELHQMAAKKFYDPYSYISMFTLSKNIKMLARLLKNDEFRSGFEASLDSFSYYKDDLRKIFEEGIQVRDRLLTIEFDLKSTVGNFFPDVIIRKITDFLFDEE